MIHRHTVVSRHACSAHASASSSYIHTYIRTCVARINSCKPASSSLDLPFRLAQGSSAFDDDVVLLVVSSCSADADDDDDDDDDDDVDVDCKRDESLIGDDDARLEQHDDVA